MGCGDLDRFLEAGALDQVEAPTASFVLANAMRKLRNGETKPKPLPQVVTGCRESFMAGRGRRFESVRGLLLNPGALGLCLRTDLHASRLRRYGAAYGAFRSERRYV
jgi:hypothetical protein